jgi:hypothetical protein
MVYSNFSTHRFYAEQPKALGSRSNRLSSCAVNREPASCHSRPPKSRSVSSGH